jgi:hypothetical protein
MVFRNFLEDDCNSSAAQLILHKPTSSPVLTEHGNSAAISTITSKRETAFPK